jgi:hypothetical protein
MTTASGAGDVALVDQTAISETGANRRQIAGRADAYSIGGFAWLRRHASSIAK